MSKDPFEELFGEDAPEPVPARERLQHEQAERVQTAQLPETKAKKAKAEKAKVDHPAKPWVIVGIVAVVALVASAIVINMARSGADPEPTPAPVPTQTQAQPTPDPAPEPTVDPEPTTEPDDGVPDVEVGPTNTMPIGPWNATSELSQKFGRTSFAIPDGTNLVLSNDLLDSFPESCSAMRDGWGATKAGDNKYELLKPAEKCAEAAELYDEVWGLTDAWVQTIRAD